jgi:hypothetical protein
VYSLLGEAEVPERAHVKKAVNLIRAFHRQLCDVRVLDPACGTGNFLYVTYDLLKDLEAEVLRRLADLGEQQLGLQISGQTVVPTQMLGIEKNPRAREIADLVLWIGHLQRMRRDGAYEAIVDPIIQESDHIECRDAVLAWDGDPKPRLDSDGEVVEDWDRARNANANKIDPVTGREIPDGARTVVVYDYPNCRQSTWPKADFIVSNPPFIGPGPMRATLGTGYTEALRGAWEHVPDSADFVMYWWDRAAELVRSGEVRRFGLITTNSIHQTFQRRVVEGHLTGRPPLFLALAIADHPWTTGKGAAAVRIAMTVGCREETLGRLLEVESESPVPGHAADLEIVESHGNIHSNLRIGMDITRARPIKANSSLCSPGVKLHGSGFILSRDEAEQLGVGRDDEVSKVVWRYRNGRDLTQVARDAFVIDLHGLKIDEVRDRYPAIYQRVYEQVKPERDHNRERYRRENWWLFGRKNTLLRSFLEGLPRYIATVETSKHRFFQFLSADIRPDNMLVNIGLTEAWVLGVLSSRVHVAWTLASGGTLEDRPRYNKTKCFDPFPFPDLVKKAPLRERIGKLAESLDAHRKEVASMGRAAGMQAHLTNQYNALARSRSARESGKALTPKERMFHAAARIGVLESLHSDLDVAVAEAYGWPVEISDEDILERLLTLNLERAAEEAQGHVRWLRPEFQAPDTASQTAEGPEVSRSAKLDSGMSVRSWPKDDAGRLAAVRDHIYASGEPVSGKDVVAAFKGARPKPVMNTLASLEALGLITTDGPSMWGPAI